MPKEITAYQAEDGSLHTDACAAARKDIELLIAGSPLAENQPYAKSLCEWLTDDPRKIIDKLGEYLDACPNDAEERALPDSLEGTHS